MHQRQNAAMEACHRVLDRKMRSLPCADDAPVELWPTPFRRTMAASDPRGGVVHKSTDRALGMALRNAMQWAASARRPVDRHPAWRPAMRGAAAASDRIRTPSAA